jgi:hypothetical protein
MALVTARRLDEARADAMAHVHDPGGLADEYAAAQELADGSMDGEIRQAEQARALDLQTARQRIREAHGQPGFRVAGDAVRG